jgi:L-asparagine transporter-like permease
LVVTIALITGLTLLLGSAIVISAAFPPIIIAYIAVSSFGFVFFSALIGATVGKIELKSMEEEIQVNVPILQYLFFDKLSNLLANE